MNAGIIVGYITQRDGSPISGADIWITQAGEFGSEREVKPVARTDSRGYFQLTFADGAVDIAEFGGKLNISVAANKSGRKNSKSSAAAENRFQVKGYLITENLKPEA